MHRHIRAILTLLAATITLAASIAGASARNISSSNQNITATWSSVEFSNTANSVTIRCQVTFEGSFHSRTIVKRAGTLVGYITRAGLGPCTNGTGTIDNTSLPWHLSYEGFTGILPNISTLRFLLTGAHSFINDGSNTCEIRTEVENNITAIVNLTRGVVASLRLDESRRVRTRGGPFGICALASVTFRGEAMVRLLNRPETSITITLI